MELLDIIIMAVGFLFIHMACDVNRPKENSILMFTGPWFLQMALIIAGVFIIDIAQ